MDDPRYVVVAMLDDPKATKDPSGFHTAGWNVAPVVSNRVIARIGADARHCCPTKSRDIDVSELLPLIVKAGDNDKKLSHAPRMISPRSTGGSASATITGFAIDHRKVAPGTVFGAFKGTRFNGEDFIGAAVKAGAVAVVARPEARVTGAVHIADANPRERFAQLAASFFAPFPRPRSRSPAPTARPRPSK